MWIETHKGDIRCRELADRHYTRQRPGHPMFCRPGYNQVLYYEDEKGSAVWVWWRPKWEDGRPGTKRKDNLKAIECTLFRNESSALSSDLIREAIDFLPKWNRITEYPDGLITGIGIIQTSTRRSKNHKPGHCYRMAGWVEFDHRAGKAGIWLKYNNTTNTTEY